MYTLDKSNCHTHFQIWLCKRDDESLYELAQLADDISGRAGLELVYFRNMIDALTFYYVAQSLVEETNDLFMRCYCKECEDHPSDEDSSTVFAVHNVVDGDKTTAIGLYSNGSVKELLSFYKGDHQFHEYDLTCCTQEQIGILDYNAELINARSDNN